VGETAGSDLEPGAKVGEFVVDRKIAEGGMGSVYAGHHPVIGKRVAVKVLAEHCAHIPDLIRRFVEEARAVNKIGHPNIIDIFSFGTLADARPFFVMEYLEGASLAARLEAADLTASETRRLLRQICSALEAAHRAEIVHRDLKPENIWIAAPAHEDSFAKVLDFGIAKLLDNPQARTTQTGAAMGTPRYMAPEQCMGRPVDRRADIYSLGVILYELFAGVVPFRGESFGELLYQHMSEAPEPPSRHRPVDPELERIILSCLEKDPAKRPQTAKDLGRLLDAALHEGPGPITQVRTTVPSAQPQSGPVTTMRQSVGELAAAPRSEEALPPPQAKKRGVGLAIAASAALVVIGGFVLMKGHSTPREPAATTAPAATASSPPPAAASPSPPSPVSTGRLQLHIAGGPADRISLDGREIARATSTVDFGEVSPGAHLVSIEAAGRDTQQSPVTVTAGAPTVLSIALKPPPRVGSRRSSLHPANLVEDPASSKTDAPQVVRPAKHSRAEEHGLMDENPFRKQ
jgi:eukaryotic-like serine/threonine-protein kinase